MYVAACSDSIAQCHYKTSGILFPIDVHSDGVFLPQCIASVNRVYHAILFLITDKNIIMNPLSNQLYCLQCKLSSSVVGKELIRELN